MNIQVKGNIENIENTSYISMEYLNSIPYNIKDTNFDIRNDFIEFYIYDLNNTIQYIDYNYKHYKILPNVVSNLLPSIEIDPILDLKNIGLSYGKYITRYNFFKNIISNSNNLSLHISEISEDRTELKIDSFVLSNIELLQQFQLLVDRQNQEEYFIPFLLNFNNNIQYLVTNIIISNNEILIKLNLIIEELSGS